MNSTVGWRDSLCVCVEQDFYAILAQDLVHFRGHILVFFTQKLMPRLDHRYLTAKAAKHLAELHPDVAPTQDHQVLGHIVELHDAFVIEIGNSVETFNRRRTAAGAGVDKELRRAQLPLPAPLEGDANLPRSGKGGFAPYQLDMRVCSRFSLPSRKLRTMARFSLTTQPCRR